MSRRLGNRSLTRLIGTAKPMPCPWLTMAVVTPTTSPLMSNNGPPELPGLMSALVWMKSSNGPRPKTRSRAEMRPCVTEVSRPNGLPMATTQSPISSWSESPRATMGSPLRLRQAQAGRDRSRGRGPPPRPRACARRTSARGSRCARSTTWLLVTTSPSALMTKPEPSDLEVPSLWVLMFTTPGRTAFTRGASEVGGWNAPGSRTPPGRSFHSVAPKAAAREPRWAATLAFTQTSTSSPRASSATAPTSHSAIARARVMPLRASRTWRPSPAQGE